MTKKKTSARVFTFITAMAMLFSFLLQNVNMLSFAASAEDGSADHPFDCEKYINVNEHSFTVNDQPVNANTVVKNGDDVDFSFSWSFNSDGIPSDVREQFRGKNIVFRYYFPEGQFENVPLDTVINSDAGEDGYYSIHFDGDRPYVDITVYNLESDDKNISGKASFSGELEMNKCEIDDNGIIDFTVFGEKFNPKVGEATEPYSLQKSAGQVTGPDANGDYWADFTVKVRQNIEDKKDKTYSGEVTLTEEFGNWYTGDFKDVVLNNETVEFDNKQLKFELDYENDATLTYKMKLDRDTILANPNDWSSRNNKVKAEFPDNSTKESTATPNFVMPSIGKTGQLQSDGKTINWTLKVKPGNLLDSSEIKFNVSDIPGNNLDSDTVLAGLKAAGVDAHLSTDGNSIVVGTDKFTKGSDWDGDYYSLTYSTEVDADLLDSVGEYVENNLKVKFDELETEYETKAHVQVGIGVDKNVLTDEVEDGILGWTVDFKMPEKGDLSYLKLNDTRGYQSGSNIGTHTYISGSLTMTVDGKTQNIEDATVSENGNGFTLEIKDAKLLNSLKGKNVTFTYKTKMAGSTNLLYQNHVDVTLKIGEDTITASDDASFTQPLSVKKEKLKSEYSFEGKDTLYEKHLYYPLGWQLVLNAQEGYYFKANDKITVVDTLPNGYVFLNNTVKYGDDIYSGMNYTDAVVTDNKDGTVNITLTIDADLAEKLNKSRNLYIAYYTAMTEEEYGRVMELMTDGDINISYDNHAEVSYNDSLLGDCDASQDVYVWKKGVLSKEIVPEDGKEIRTDSADPSKHYVEYKIDFNSECHILNNGEKITLKDVMGTELKLRENTLTVNVYPNRWDTNPTNVTKDALKKSGGQEMTFELEDGKHYVITYQADITLYGAEDSTLSDEEVSEKYGNDVTFGMPNVYTMGGGYKLASGSFTAKSSVRKDSESTRVDIKVTKQWDYGDNWTATRANSFQVSLITHKYKDGKEEETTTKHYTGTGETWNTTWTMSIDNLPVKDTDGFTYTYEIAEVKMNGFKVSYEAGTNSEIGKDCVEVDARDLDFKQDSSNTYLDEEVTLTIKNTYTNEVELTGTKTWSDFSDKYEIRPTMNEFKSWLKVSDNKGAVVASSNYTVEVSESSDKNVWNYKIGGLPELSEGDYTVEEVIPEKYKGIYTSEKTGNNFTNTLETQNGKLTVKKSWDTTGSYPDVTFVLTGSDKSVYTKVIKSGESEVVFDDLPMFEYVKATDGTVTQQKITYTLKENAVEGYESSIPAAGKKVDFGAAYAATENVTNTEIEKPTVEITGTKTWSDFSDKYAIRPTAKDFASWLVVKDNKGVVVDSSKYTVEVNESSDKNVWNYKIGGLPELSEGDYTVEEVIPEKYKGIYTSETKGNNFTNTLETQNGKLTVKKSWDTTGSHPDVTFELTGSDKSVYTKVIKSGESEVVFENLPMFEYVKATDGTVTQQKITYTLKEKAVEGYKSNIPADGKKVDFGAAYAATENVTNTVETTDLSITKVWDDDSDKLDKRPDDITLTVKADGVALDADEYKLEQVSKSGDKWTYTVKGLPKYQADGKTAITYTIEETPVNGYKAPKYGSDGYNLKVTNTIEDIDKTPVSITKEWKGNDSGFRPDAETFKSWLTLYAGGELYTEDVEFVVTVKDENNWTITVEDLPKYRTELLKNGLIKLVPVVYQIVEEIPASYGELYTKSIDKDGNLVNEFNEVKTKYEVTVNKKWVYPDNLKSAETVKANQPKSVQVEVTITDKTGTITKTETLTITGTGLDWTGTVEFNDLPKYQKLGTEYEYSVKSIEEVKVPDGYKAEVDLAANTVTNTYETTSVKINKYDIANSEEVVGAELKVFDSKNKLVGEWQSKKGETWTIEGLTPGEKYTLKETNTPDGYNSIETDIVFTVDEDGTVTVVEGKDDATVDKNGVLLVNNTKKTTSVKINKYDIANSEEVAGATLEVLDSNGKPVDTWESKKGETWTIEGLTPGEEYTLRETYTPDGYNSIETDIVFTVDENGTATVVEGKDDASVDKNGVLLVNNTKKTTSVTINKYDIAHSEEVDGAKLEVFDSKGESVGEWKSETGKTWTIEGLTPGEEYTLRETSTPDGYNSIETDIVFTVDENGTVTVVEGKDDATVDKDGVLLVNNTKKTTSVTINKYDIAHSEEVDGAWLKVLDSKGELVGFWESETGKTWTIEGLTPGEKYTLKETVTPDGYNSIETDIVFTVDENGKVEVVSGKDGSVDKNGVLLVNNTKKPETTKTTSVTINKYDIANSEEVDGAKLQVFDSKNKLIGEWKSETGKTWTIEGLTPGEEYTLRETNTPDGYNSIETDIVFTVDENGKVEVVSGKDGSVDKNGVLLVNNTKKPEETKTTSVTINKYDIAHSEEVDGATLQVFDSKGELVGFWKSETGKTWTIEGLTPGEEYTLRETVTPDGYNSIETDIVFTVDENGKVTVVSGKDGSVDKNGVLLVNNTKKPETTKTTSVTINKYDIANSEEVDGAELKVFDSKGESVGEWESKTGKTWTIEGLTPGEEYTLRETVTPDGYNSIETDIVFTVDEDGTVTVVSGKDGSVDEETGILLVNNTKKPETTKTTSVTINKYDIAHSEEVDGATLEVFDSKGESVGDWTSKPGETWTIEGLTPGEEYTLRETVTPDGYNSIETDIVFTVDENGKVEVVSGKDGSVDKNGVLLVNNTKKPEETKPDDYYDVKDLIEKAQQIIEDHPDGITTDEEYNEIKDIVEEIEDVLTNENVREEDAKLLESHLTVIYGILGDYESKDKTDDTDFDTDSDSKDKPGDTDSSDTDTDSDSKDTDKDDKTPDTGAAAGNACLILAIAAAAAMVRKKK